MDDISTTTRRTRTLIPKRTSDALKDEPAKDKIKPDISRRGTTATAAARRSATAVATKRVLGISTTEDTIDKTQPTPLPKSLARSRTTRRAGANLPLKRAVGIPKTADMHMVLSTIAYVNRRIRYHHIVVNIFAAIFCFSTAMIPTIAEACSGIEKLSLLAAAAVIFGLFLWFQVWDKKFHFDKLFRWLAYRTYRAVIHKRKIQEKFKDVRVMYKNGRFSLVE